MPELTGWGQLTPWGLILMMLASFFVLLSRGKLYTGNQHDEVVKGQQGITEIYKASDEKKDAIITEQSGQIGLLVNQLEIISHFLKDADRIRATTPNSGATGTQEVGPHVR